MAKNHANRRPRRASRPDRALIYGNHAVEAALANPERVVHRLLATRNAAERVSLAAHDRGIEIKLVSVADLDRLLGPDTVHQGLAIEAESLVAPSIDTLGHARLVVILDQVTDPHNVGAVLRSAAAFGAGALVLTERRSPVLSSALAKAASGALEHVPVVTVTNLARALETLAGMGFTRIGLDGDADIAFEDQAFTPPLALVLGREDKGLRRLTRENCDHICRLTTPGPLKSLNVSNAAAVALHAISTSDAWRPPAARISGPDQ